MKRLTAETGRFALSKAGRDIGRCFIILEVIDEQFVTVADGKLRKLARPKKKKLMHLRLKPQIAEGIKQKLQNGTLLDSDIRNAIDSLSAEETIPAIEN